MAIKTVGTIQSIQSVKSVKILIKLLLQYINIKSINIFTGVKRSVKLLLIDNKGIIAIFTLFTLCANARARVIPARASSLRK